MGYMYKRSKPVNLVVGRASLPGRAWVGNAVSGWRLSAPGRVVWGLTAIFFCATAGLLEPLVGPPRTGLLAQEVRILERQIVSGQIVATSEYSLTLRQDDGRQYDVLFQNPGVRVISLTGDAAISRVTAEIEVLGRLPISLLRPGMAVRVELDLAVGRQPSVIRRWTLLPVDHDQFSAGFLDRPSTGSDDPQPAEVVGTVIKLERGKVFLKLPKSEVSPQGGLALPVAMEDLLEFRDTDMQEVRRGDRVEAMEILQFSTGDWIAKEIRVQLAADRPAVQAGPEHRYRLKYRHLDNRPVPPREVRSKNFLVKTDLSPRSTKILLDKLEEMFAIIGEYYGRRSLGQLIVCYVVDDLQMWKGLEHELTEGLEQIEAGSGVTRWQRLGKFRRAFVYSCGDHSVVQHEAVHAFCHIAFGDVGPIWYAEGMAELGNHWRPREVGVNVNAFVLRHLKTTPPKSLAEIVQPGQLSGDAWRAYSWRWALCYMLVNNPNYGRRFHRLGDAMMRPNSRANFYTEFMDVIPELSFEYQLFLTYLGNGYQQELCSWDWRTKAIGLQNGRMARCEIEARRGWQATSAALVAGETCELVAQGKWSLDGKTMLDADGDADGNGRLIGAILTRHEPGGQESPFYTLSAEFPLGSKVTFTAVTDGHLFVRCNEDLTQIGDNSGKLKVAIRQKK